LNDSTGNTTIDEPHTFNKFGKTYIVLETTAKSYLFFRKNISENAEKIHLP